MFWKIQAPHIDKTDFLNAAVREKKRFENALDESVAGGLNAGTDVLMNQVGEFVKFHFYGIDDFFLGRAYYFDVDGTEGVLSAGGCAVGVGTDEGVYGGDSVFGDAL